MSTRKRAPKPATEREIVDLCIAGLRAHFGPKTPIETEVKSHGLCVADIAFYHDGAVHLVEVKRTGIGKGVWQAIFNQFAGDYSWLALWQGCAPRADLKEDMDRYRIGLFNVTPAGTLIRVWPAGLQVTVNEKVRRKVLKQLVEY